MNAHHRAVAVLAAAYGLELRPHRRGGHLHLVDPGTGRRVITVSSSPRDRSGALRQIERDLRRQLPPQGGTTP